MKEVVYIYRKIFSFDSRISLIPRDDVYQEIRIALWESGYDFFKALKKSNLRIGMLLSDYGYSRKKGKDNFPEVILHSEMSEEQWTMLDLVENLYIDKGMTAQEVCKKLGVECNTSIASLLSKVFPKNMGKGGRRKGSGNKKGWNKPQNQPNGLSEQ